MGGSSRMLPPSASSSSGGARYEGGLDMWDSRQHQHQHQHQYSHRSVDGFEGRADPLSLGALRRPAGSSNRERFGARNEGMFQSFDAGPLAGAPSSTAFSESRGPRLGLGTSEVRGCRGLEENRMEWTDHCDRVRSVRLVQGARYPSEPSRSEWGWDRRREDIWELGMGGRDPARAFFGSGESDRRPSLGMQSPHNQACCIVMCT
jgi:hypothetical protein